MNIIVKCGFCGRFIKWKEAVGNYFVGYICKDCSERYDEYGEERGKNELDR